MARIKLSPIAIGERIKERRESLNISQAAAAEMIGITPPTLSAYESNKAQPSMPILRKMAEIYQSSVDYLMGIANNPTLNEMDSLHRICKQHGGNDLDQAVSLLFDLTGDGLVQALTYLKFLDSQEKYSIQAQEYKADRMLEENDNGND